jgi:hypothetical protein
MFFARSWRLLVEKLLERWHALSEGDEGAARLPEAMISTSFFCGEKFERKRRRRIQEIP